MAWSSFNAFIAGGRHAHEYTATDLPGFEAADVPGGGRAQDPSRRDMEARLMQRAFDGVAFDFNKIGFDSPEENIHYVSAPYIHRRPAGMTVEDFCDHLVQDSKTRSRRWGRTDHGHGRIPEICTRYGILIIADEVVTGFCRLGEFFASDIVTCAKGLTSGYVPMGAVLMSHGIREVSGKPNQAGAMFTHGFTCSGHPVCCVAALANIAVMEKLIFAAMSTTWEATSRKPSARFSICRPSMMSAAGNS